MCRARSTSRTASSPRASPSSTDAKGRDIVVYCRSGVRAAQALGVLDKAGFKRLFHLQGDYNRWTEEQRPVVK